MTSPRARASRVGISSSDTARNRRPRRVTCRGPSTVMVRSFAQPDRMAPASPVDDVDERRPTRGEADQRGERQCDRQSGQSEQHFATDAQCATSLPSPTTHRPPTTFTPRSAVTRGTKSDDDNPRRSTTPTKGAGVPPGPHCRGRLRAVHRGLCLGREDGARSATVLVVLAGERFALPMRNGRSLDRGDHAGLIGRAAFATA